jgi:YVTN family beta-propeller protein
VRIDLQTTQVVSNVRVGSLPFGIAGDNQYLYVVNFGSDTLSVLNDNGATLATIPVGVRPTFVEAMDGCAFVTNYAWPGSNRGGISVYCPQTGAQTTILPQIPGFFGIASDPATHRVFAANRGFGRENAIGIYVIDGNSRQVMDFIPISINVPGSGESARPFEMAYNPHSRRLFVVVAGLARPGADYVALDEVWVYNPSGNSFDHTPAYRLQVGAQLADTLEVNGGEGIYVVSDKVYVSNYAGKSLSIIQDTAGPTVTALNAAPAPAQGNGTVILDHYVYLPLVAQSAAFVPQVIATLDLSEGTPASRLDCIGNCPKGIAYAGGYVYVSLFGSGKLARILPMYPYPSSNIMVTPVGAVSYINQLLGEK